MDGNGDGVASHCLFAWPSDRLGPALLAEDSGTGMRIGLSSFLSQWDGLTSGSKIDGDKLNEWVHVAVTVTGSQQRLYVDGKLAGSRSVTTDLSTLSGKDLYLGTFYNAGTWWYPLNGVLDEVRVYNRALSLAEVSVLAECCERGFAENNPFRLSRTQVTLAVGETVTVDMLNGSGSYSLGSNVGIVDYSINTQGECFTLTGMGVGTTNVTVIDVSSQTTILLPVTVTANTHEWVDLGLPSGTLWATCNVGASAPEEYGDYFAWGETAPKDYYDWSTYKWCNGSYTTMTKYCTDSSYGYNGFVDNKTELDPEDDAAYVNWGSSWRMPSKEQQDELREKCTWTRTTQNGVNGYLVTGPNGNTLFLPAAGNRWGVSLNYVGSYGYYWSRTLYSSYPYYAYYLYFDSGNVYWYYISRNYGFAVRAVRVSQN